jgi:hypothetical protein
VRCVQGELPWTLLKVTSQTSEMYSRGAYSQFDLASHMIRVSGHTRNKYQRRALRLASWTSEMRSRGVSMDMTEIRRQLDAGYGVQDEAVRSEIDERVGAFTLLSETDIFERCFRGHDRDALRG